MKIVIVAIVGIVIMELVALGLGYNGTILTTSVGAVAGLAGLATKRPKIFRE